MPRLFCVSDIHGFYDELITALDEAGFDKDNEDHWLICCGDYFDRGPYPTAVMYYLRDLTRKILIRGNHEDLVVECCERGFPYRYDFSNGTVGTINELGGAGEGLPFDECCAVALEKVTGFFKTMVNYFETENYVFVHGWLPGVPFEKNPKWREADSRSWDDARWKNGMQNAMVAPIEKTVVCGHYHASWGRAHIDGIGEEFGEDADFSPFYMDGCIAIDACTALTHRVNVLVLEDEFLEVSRYEMVGSE